MFRLTQNFTRYGYTVHTTASADFVYVANGITSRYVGVSWYKRDKKWVATMRIEGKQHNLGSFDDEKKAAGTYDAAAKMRRGEFAPLNFPEKRSRTVDG